MRKLMKNLKMEPFDAREKCHNELSHPILGVFWFL